MANETPVAKDLAGGDMRALVEQVAKALVDEPEQVSVEAVERPDGTVLELRVAAGDVGKVIGKQGRTARAVRTILGARPAPVALPFAERRRQ